MWLDVAPVVAGAVLPRRPGLCMSVTEDVTVTIVDAHGYPATVSLPPRGGAGS